MAPLHKYGSPACGFPLITTDIRTANPRRVPSITDKAIRKPLSVMLVKEETTRMPGITMSPKPMKKASRSSLSSSFSFSPFVSLSIEYFRVFGTTSMTGNLRSITASARSIMCLVLYTEMASYIDRPMSSRITRNMLREMPNIPMAPTPTIMPHKFMMYHSGCLMSATIKIAVAIIERNDDITSGTTKDSSG